MIQLKKTLAEVQIDRPVNITLIPPDLKKLVQEIPLYLRKIKMDYRGVYASGSWVRGQFTPNSDIDLFITLSSQVYNRNSTYLNKTSEIMSNEFYKNYQNTLDVKFINIDSKDIKDIVRQVILITDGCLINGKETPFDLKRVRLDFLIMGFNKIYQERLEQTDLYSSDKATRQAGRRMYSKLILRWIKNLSVIHGGKISASLNIEEIIHELTITLPQYVNDANITYEIFTKKLISNADIKVLNGVYKKLNTSYSNYGELSLNHWRKTDII